MQYDAIKYACILVCSYIKHVAVPGQKEAQFYSGTDYFLARHAG